MTTFRLRRLAVLALSLSFLPAVHAQTLDFGSCVRIEDLSARLACYDRAAGRTPAASSPAAPAATMPAPAAPAAPPPPAAPPARAAQPAPTPMPAPPPPAAPRAPAPPASANPEASFGQSSLPAAKQEERRAEPEQIRARVASVRKLPRGEQVLTLENGQVWQQTEVRSEPQFSPGDEVIIRRAMFGSYLLSMAKGSATTRVRRIS